MSESARLSRLVDFDDLEGSMTKLGNLAREQQDPLKAVEIETLIARVKGLQGHYREALYQLGNLEQGLPGGDHVAAVRVHLEKGRCFNDTSKREEATHCFKMSLAMSSRIGEEFLAMDAAHMLAIVGDLNSQVEWGERAIRMLEEVEDPDAKSWRGPIVNNLGWSYYEAGDFSNALLLFNESVDFRKDGPKRPHLIARYSVAKCLRAMGRTEESLAQLIALREENQQLGFDAPYVEEELAECLYEKGQKSEAASHFKAAHELLSKNACLCNTEPHRIARLLELSKVKEASA